MRLFPAQSFRAPLSRLSLAAVLYCGFAIVATAAPIAGQDAEIDLEELRAWAEKRVADGRLDQVELRFGPLTQRLQDQGRVEAAAELLRAWLDLSGGASAVAAKRLAQLLLEGERFDDLVELVSRHRVQAGDSALALEMALARWELGRLQEAEREFQNALAGSTPETTSGLVEYQWARFLSWYGRAAESWTQYESLIGGRLGSSADVVLGAARACTAALAVGACDVNRAVELAERAVELLPEHTGARYNLVRALEAAGAKERARAEVEGVRGLLAADQERTRARGLSQARAVEAEMRLRESGAESAYDLLCAEASLEQCLADGWRSAEEWLALARALWGGEQRAAAIILLERLVASHPDRGEWRGLLLGWRQQVDRASN